MLEEGTKNNLTDTSLLYLNLRILDQSGNLTNHITSQLIKNILTDTSLSNLNIQIIDVSANLTNHITSQLIKNNLTDTSLSNLNIQILDVSANLTNHITSQATKHNTIDISLSNFNEQLLLKQNVIDESNKLSALNVQPTYGLDGNMTWSEAIVDLKVKLIIMLVQFLS